MMRTRVGLTTRTGPPRLTDDPKLQADKFRELARELECDEDEAAFKEQVRRVAKAPPLGG
jgi:hypothetical protein